MSGYTGSQAQAGRGSTLSIGATPTLIGEITDLPLDLPKWDTADVTNLESGMDSEVLPTIRKTASITIKGNRVSSDAGQMAVMTAYGAGTKVAFTVTLPKTATQTSTGDSWAFSGYVLSASFTVNPTKQIDFSIDIESSGAFVPTAGS